MRTLFEPEHDAFRESFAAFVAKEITPHYLRWEADGIAPRSTLAPPKVMKTIVAKSLGL